MLQLGTGAVGSGLAVALGWLNRQPERLLLVALGEIIYQDGLGCKMADLPNHLG